MPSLDDVTQRFVADTIPYIEALRAAGDAADAFIAKNAAVIESMKAVGEAGAGAALGTAGLAAAERNLADASADLMMQTALLASMDERLATIQRDAADSSADLMMQTDLQRHMFEELNGVIDATIAHYAALDAAQNKAAGSSAAASRRFLGGWGLTGNAIHWIISGLAEYLAVALPGTIALAAGAFVMYQGVVEQVGFRMESLYTATESTSAMIHKTTGDVLGLGHAFQTAQNAANPVAYQLLGEYINGAKANMTNFAAAGLTVARMLGELGAKMDVDLTSHAREFQSLIANMVTDLQEFGQILGNIGHALLNFASDMPGLAEKLLWLADAISKIILWLSGLNHYLILSVMAFEEFNRWGGLLVTILGKMGLAMVTTTAEAGAAAAATTALGDASEAAGAKQAFIAKGIFSVSRATGILKNVIGVVPSIIGAVGEKISAFADRLPVLGEQAAKAGDSMAEFGETSTKSIAALSGPEILGIAALAAGIGFLTYKLITAKTAAQEFGDNLQKAVISSSNVNVLGTIVSNMSELATRTTSAANAVNEYADASRKAMTADAGRGEMLGDLPAVTVAYHNAAGAAEGYTAAQRQQMSDVGNVIAGVNQLSNAYGTTFAQSLALADAANVSLVKGITGSGNAAEIARAQVAGLVQGYRAMDQVGGTLGADMNAVAIQTGLADTQVSKLNSAWDQFVSNATGVTSNLASMNQDLAELGNVGVEVGKKFTAFSGTTQLAVDKTAKALESFRGTGAQAWQNYDGALQQAEQLTDSYRTAAAYGAVTTRQFTGVIAETTASLLPFAKHSKTAVEELSALAQQAGGPATDSYKTLKKWVDDNDISAKQFNKDVQTMTGSLSNAGAAAAEFASTLQSQLQAELATVVAKGSNANTIMSNFQTAVENSGGAVSTHSSQYKQLYNLLLAAGQSATQAKNEIAEMQTQIDALHSKPVDISLNINTNYTQSGTPPITPGQAGSRDPGGRHGMTVGFAGGGMVNGPFGTDAIHAMLTAGEAVLTARAVQSLGGPLAVHALNTQPSQAVYASGGGGGGTDLTLNLGVQTKLDSRTLTSNRVTESLKYTRRNPRNNLNLRAR